MDNNRELDQEEVRQKLDVFLEEQGLKVVKVAEMIQISKGLLSSFKTGNAELGKKSLLMLDNLMNTYEVKYRVL